MAEVLTIWFMGFVILWTLDYTTSIYQCFNSGDRVGWGARIMMSAVWYILWPVYGVTRWYR